MPVSDLRVHLSCLYSGLFPVKYLSLLFLYFFSFFLSCHPGCHSLFMALTFCYFWSILFILHYELFVFVWILTIFVYHHLVISDKFAQVWEFCLAVRSFLLCVDQFCRKGSCRGGILGNCAVLEWCILSFSAEWPLKYGVLKNRAFILIPFTGAILCYEHTGIITLSKGWKHQLPVWLIQDLFLDQL